MEDCFLQKIVGFDFCWIPGCPKMPETAVVPFLTYLDSEFHLQGDQFEFFHQALTPK